MSSRSSAVAFIMSAMFTIIIVGVIVLVDEYNPGFHRFLISLTGYHWLTKSFFAALFFVFFSVVFYFGLKLSRVREKLHADNVWVWTVALIAVTVVIYLVTFATFLIEYLS